MVKIRRLCATVLHSFIVSDSPSPGLTTLCARQTPNSAFFPFHRLADSDVFDKIQENLPPPGALKSIKLQPIEFEKDDDTNLHMDFITAASNLRAENYDIAPADKHKVRAVYSGVLYWGPF